MTKIVSLSDIVNILTSALTINQNNEQIEEAFDNTLSRDGSAPNQMEADIDLNSNNVVNVSTLYTQALNLKGQTVVALSAVPSWEGNWATSTSYAVDDLVHANNQTYICVVAHTSGTFNDDLADAKWELFAAQGAAGAGTGDLLASNNLSDVSSINASLANLGAGTATMSGVWTRTGDTCYTDNTTLCFGTQDDVTHQFDGTDYTVTIATANSDYQIKDSTGDLLFKAFDQGGIGAYYRGSLRYETIDGGLELYRDLVLNEQSDHTFTPTAAHGQIWVKDETPNKPIFTDDAGADHYLNQPVLIVEDQKVQNTQGGTFTLGDWRTRALNTAVVNEIENASLASNQITLPAGTYEIDASAPTYNVNSHQLRLYDTTGAAVLLTGGNEYSGDDGDGSSRASLKGRFTLSVSSVLELQHRCSKTQSTNGLGLACNFGTEVYSQAVIRKVKT